MQGDLFVQSMSGDLPIYPGHPLVLATAIMDLYPNLASALAPVKSGCSAALSDERLSGAGCHMRAALTCLGIGAGGGSVPEMVECATRYWVDGQAGGHVGQVDAGSAQAEKMSALFQETVQDWLKA